MEFTEGQPLPMQDLGKVLCGVVYLVVVGIWTITYSLDGGVRIKHGLQCSWVLCVEPRPFFMVLLVWVFVLEALVVLKIQRERQVVVGGS